jgi:hypothetical protein
MLRLGVAFALIGLAASAKGDELPRVPVVVRPVDPPIESPSKTVEPAATKSNSEAPKPEKAAPAPAESKESATGAEPAEPDAATLRAATSERLGKLPKADDKSATSASKKLRDVLEDRLKWLDEWDKAVKERLAAESPEPNPAKQAAKWKTELEQASASLAQTVKEPETVLPPAFRKLPAIVPESQRLEMKESIDTAQGDLKEASSQLERARAATVGKDSTGLAAMRAARDQTYKRVAGLKARSVETEAAVNLAKTPEARDLAQEKLINFQWESRAEVERLRALESQLTLEAKRSDVSGLHLQLLDAQVKLAQATLDSMKTRYRSMTQKQESELQSAAAKEKSRAEKVEDPLEHFRAQRNAELLELEARVTRNESALTTGTPPLRDEQKQLADRAETDLAEIKKLLDDGEISHLDAIRLNNDFRRIGAERASIVRKELVITESRLALAANALGTVELDLINADRDDRFELENLLEKLPKSDQARAYTVCDELEKRHRGLLGRRREALKKLAARAEETHEEVLRRLRILDDHFGFIRTHMFWVRDDEPFGIATVEDAERELRQISRASIKIFTGAVDAKGWGRISPEFLVSALGLVLLPWPLRRLRRALRSNGPAGESA